MCRRRWMGNAAKTALTGVLCGLMVFPDAALAAASADKVTVPKRTQRAAPLTEQERVLHALNRFTFGPGPGDVEAVERMGLDKWFVGQLRPETIDDSAFEARMSRYPAMRLAQADLMQRFPSQTMVRMADKRDLPMPHDRVEYALLADAKYEYELKQKEQALAQTPNAQPATAAQATSSGQSGLPMNINPPAVNSAANDARARRQTMMGMAALDEADAKPPAAAPQNMQASLQMAGGNAMDDANPELNRKGKPKVKGLAEPVAPDQVQSVLRMPPDQRLERLVEMRPEEMFAFRSALKPAQKMHLIDGMQPEDAEIAESFVTAPERVIGAEILNERLERDVFSERQLQAVMTDFWLNHFSVYLRKDGNEPYYLPAYERDAILPNALGKFENLLVAVAQSPAMLMYLDNWQSVGPHSDKAEKAERAQMFRPANKQRPEGINENYARELMELHTLGVNGGYTQQDVIEVAKCFTGWTIDKPALNGQAIFDETKHEPGTKVVLGHKIKESGQKEGLQVLHILATSPATAHFVSLKLAVRFVSDDPPPALVNRMAAAFLKTDGNIKLVLLAMFRSPEFWSPQVYRAKVKTPIEFMASALRASGASVNNAFPLVLAMDSLGMPIYGMQTPQGYSWKSEDWVSSSALISRMNFALVLSGNRLQGVKTDWTALLGGGDATLTAPITPDVETENRLEIALLGEPASDRTRSTVLAQFGDPTVEDGAEEAFRARPVQEDAAMVPSAGLLRGKAGRGGPQPGRASPLDTMAGLLLGSPEFQRR